MKYYLIEYKSKSWTDAYNVIACCKKEVVDGENPIEATQKLKQSCKDAGCSYEIIDIKEVT